MVIQGTSGRSIARIGLPKGQPAPQQPAQRLSLFYRAIAFLAKASYPSALFLGFALILGALTPACEGDMRDVPGLEQLEKDGGVPMRLANDVEGGDGNPGIEVNFGNPQSGALKGVNADNRFAQGTLHLVMIKALYGEGLSGIKNLFVKVVQTQELPENVTACIPGLTNLSVEQISPEAAYTQDAKLPVSIVGARVIDKRTGKVYEIDLTPQALGTQCGDQTSGEPIKIPIPKEAYGDVAKLEVEFDVLINGTSAIEGHGYGMDLQASLHADEVN